jgi:2-oxoisovalerate dehydrogenase E2 component (dihydrolipoyl transacylase)
LADVQATGKDGRVLKEDILHHIAPPKSHPQPHKIKGHHAPAQPQQTPQHAPPQAPSHAPQHVAKAVKPVEPEATPIATAVQDRIVPLSGYAKVMVKTMTAANAIPHFGYCDEIIVDSLIQLRKDLKQIAESKGVKLTYMPIILKATSLALLKYPILNSSYDAAESTIVYKGSHNIGVAVDR